jgi:ribonuclease HI
MKLDKIYIYTDGAARGNPGPAAIGIVIYDENKNVLAEYKECIGEATNNTAEYKALIKGLELAAAHCRREVYCFLDSEVVVRQLNRTYRIKARHLLELFYILKDREKAFDKVVYNHARRDNRYISRADKLVNEALDNGITK